MTGRNTRLEHDWFDRPLPPNVELGEGTWLYSTYAFLHYRSEAPCGLRVGSDSGLYNGTFFDLGPAAEVRIGSYCALVGAIVATDGRVELGDYAFVAHEVVIAAQEAPLPPGARCGGAAAPAGAGDVRLGRNVWVGTRAIILGGSMVGDNCIVGAGSVVAGEFPADSILAGNPARIVRRL